MSLFECLSLGVCVFLCELVCLSLGVCVFLCELVCLFVCVFESVCVRVSVGRQGSIDELSWIDRC